jgi:hypothetical protein
MRRRKQNLEDQFPRTETEEWKADLGCSEAKRKCGITSTSHLWTKSVDLNHIGN